jgi:hypothetical protein
MKNTVFWDVTLCGSCKNQRSEENSSETSVLKRATRYNIPEDGILHLVYYSNKSYEILHTYKHIITRLQYEVELKITEIAVLSEMVCFQKKNVFQFVSNPFLCR